MTTSVLFQFLCWSKTLVFITMDSFERKTNWANLNTCFTVWLNNSRDRESQVCNWVTGSSSNQLTGINTVHTLYNAFVSDILLINHQTTQNVFKRLLPMLNSVKWNLNMARGKNLFARINIKWEILCHKVSTN